RERELAELVAALERVREWEGRYVEIVAEPGLGKSRLVEELKTKAEGDPVYTASCVEYESGTPYAALRALLRPILGLDGLGPAAAVERLADVVAELAPRLVPWIPLIAAPLQLEVPMT